MDPYFYRHQDPSSGKVDIHTATFLKAVLNLYLVAKALSTVGHLTLVVLVNRATASAPSAASRTDSL